MTAAPPTIIIGGGLAGLAAALRLADAGHGVTLVETRKRLGGRATSFLDPDTGQLLDNCQHVLMGACTNLLDLYHRLGVADRLAWHNAYHFIDAAGRRDTLHRDDLPAPLHMLVSLLGFVSLTWAEKWAILRAMAAIMQVTPATRRHLAGQSFARFLATLEPPAGAVDKFFAPIVTSACNETPDRVAASVAIHVFQQGFLQHADACAMALPAGPLLELYDKAGPRIEAAGGRVMLGAGAAGFDYHAGRVTALRLADGSTLAGEHFIAAVPHDRLARLVTDAMVADDDRLARLDQLEVSPIIGIHLFLRRDDGLPVMDLPHAALTQSPLQWIFNKSVDGQAGDASLAGAEHLHGVISAAHDWVHRSADDILAMALAEVRQTQPAARDARLIHGRVIKEKRATFSAAPGTHRLRPAATGAIANLILAGDWVDTGWPATMEGAVRSGYRAAAVVEPSLAPALTDDLPIQWPYRLLAG